MKIFVACAAAIGLLAGCATGPYYGYAYDAPYAYNYGPAYAPGYVYEPYFYQPPLVSGGVVIGGGGGGYHDWHRGWNGDRHNWRAEHGYWRGDRGNWRNRGDQVARGPRSGPRVQSNAPDRRGTQPSTGSANERPARPQG